MENKGKNKNKKRLLILVALVGVMGIGGVVAATSISINAGVPISLGAGYTTATTCDAAVDITTTNEYNTGTNLYNISENARIPSLMNFGKHKGAAITDIPKDYKEWLLKQADLDPYLKKALES